MRGQPWIFTLGQGHVLDHVVHDFGRQTDKDLRTRHVRLTLEGQGKLASVLPGYFLMIGDAMDKPG